MIQPDPLATSSSDETAVLRLENVSKVYHLWKSPTERFRFGLWNQIPAWAPAGLRTVAVREKERLGKRFEALHGVSLEVRPGEVVGVLGRNGSGKSTLLQIVAGTLTPTAGRVTMRGRITALLELGSGFNPEFTGRENVFLNAAILGVSRQEAQARLPEILAFSELAEFIDQPVKTYSSGMTVRLAFAVQVLMEPQILIVDEALAVGDIFFQQKCYEHMRSLVERGVSVLLATHDFGAVYQFCDRALVLDHGQEVFAGSAQEAVRKFFYLTAGKKKAGTSSPSARKADVSDNENPATALRTRFRDWPKDEYFTRVGKEQHDLHGSARCVRYCVLNSGYERSTLFEQGETAKIFFEFEVAEDWATVSPSFSLKDRTGQLIHAKHALQSEAFSMLPTVRRDSLVRCAAEITFHLQPDQYTLEFGLIAILLARKDLLDRPSLDLSALQAAHQRLASTKPVCVIYVNPRTIYAGFQIAHYGLVNLPSRVESENVRVPANPNTTEAAAPDLLSGQTGNGALV